MNSNYLASQVVFGITSNDVDDAEQTFENEAAQAAENADTEVLAPGYKRPSPYVTIFEENVKEIWEHEGILLDEGERNALFAYSIMPYRSRYILSRLALRKPDQWHTVSSLVKKHTNEVGEHGVNAAADELCRPVADLIKERDEEEWKQQIKKEKETGFVKFEEDDKPLPPKKVYIDLTMDSDESKQPSEEDFMKLDLSFFCQDETHMTLKEALERLLVPQLKELTREVKCKTAQQTKPGMIKALLDYARNQKDLKSLLPSTGKGKGKKAKPSPGNMRQTTLGFPVIKSSRSQEERLHQLAIKKLGRCVRLNQDFHLLVRRLDIIFYRSTQLPPSFLRPSLLTFFKKRDYPPYTHARSEIWRSREEYLKYEKALELQHFVEELMDPASINMERIRSGNSMTPVICPSRAYRFMTPCRSMTRDSIMVTPGSRSKIKTPKSAGTPALGWGTPCPPGGFVKKEEEEEEKLVVEEELVMVDISRIIHDDGEQEEEEEEEGLQSGTASDEKRRRYRKLVTLYDQVIRGMWESCLRMRQAAEEATGRVHVKSEDEDDREMQVEGERRPGLERFEEGYVLTRIVGEVTEAMGKLRLYDRELEVLEALLAQRFWRRGKRGNWYDRRAMLLMSHLPRIHTDSKQELYRRARRGVIEALEDDDTHLVMRSELVKRLVTLESRLKIPEDERYNKGEFELAEPRRTVVWAVRAEPKTRPGVKLDADGKAVEGATGKGKWSWKEKDKGKEKENQLTNYLIPSKKDGADKDGDKDDVAEVRAPWTGKSVWEGRDGEEVNVETRALQEYEAEGYKGFHSETRILTTIFALLLWDIIFDNIPGAFETKFQIAPLDLVLDSFYHARKEQIEKRLEEIRGGHAKEILQRHDRLHRPKETWCIGVQWKLCPAQDLEEIVECMGGEVLAVICKTFCEDYPGRSSGVPDLILWNYDKLHCKFVEVKGPNDSARPNQKLWFHTLVEAGLDVDICNVMEPNTKNLNAEKKEQEKERRKEEKRAKAAAGRKAGSSKSKAVVPVESEDEEDQLEWDEMDDEGEWRAVDDVSETPARARKRQSSEMEAEDLEEESRVLSLSQEKSEVEASAEYWPLKNSAEVVITSPRKKAKI